MNGMQYILLSLQILFDTIFVHLTHIGKTRTETTKKVNLFFMRNKALCWFPFLFRMQIHTCISYSNSDSFTHSTKFECHRPKKACLVSHAIQENKVFNPVNINTLKYFARRHLCLSLLLKRETFSLYTCISRIYMCVYIEKKKCT